MKIQKKLPLGTSWQGQGKGQAGERQGRGRVEAGECGSDGRSRAWEEQSREGQARGRVEAGGGKVRTGIGKGVGGVGG